MPRPIVDLQQQRRELRRRIGRLRRRIDGRIRGAAHQARRLGSWRTYVKRYPGHAVAAALGIGLWASAGARAGRISRWLAARLLRKTSRQIVRQFCNELGQIWADGRAKTNAVKNTGADDGRT